jgi:hemerythrin
MSYPTQSLYRGDIKMPFKEWKNEYNVAVKKFNDAHKELFSYLNNLHQGVVAGLGITNMTYILKGLLDYTTNHFRDEERLMKKYNYPEYESHKKEHDALLAKVSEYYTEFQQGHTSFSFELLSFLDKWITNHILHTDMKYKPFFKEIAKKQKE